LFLLILAWVLPMIIIVYCNIGIAYNNKSNNRELMEMMLAKPSNRNLNG
jgi:hypothetical protein